MKRGNSTNLSYLARLPRDVLYFNSVFYLVLGAMYIGFPMNAGFLIDELYFFTYFLVTIGCSSLLCAVFFKKRVVSGLIIPLYLLTALLFFFLFLFLNSIYNVYIAILSIIMVVLNLFALVMSQALKNPKVSNFLVERSKFYKKVDMKRKNPRLKTSILIISLCTVAVLGVGSYTAWGRVITVKAPDDFKTTSSYWGTPGRTLVTITRTITPVDNNTLLISNSSLSSPVSKLINGSIAYVLSVNYSTDPFNYCNYSAGAKSYPNGTVVLSDTLPNMTDVYVTFKYVSNIEVFQWLKLGNSTCITNFGMAMNDAFNDTDFFEHIADTYIFQLMDFWEVKYYINIANEHDFPHVFNTFDTVPMGYMVLDWFDYQRGQGLGTSFIGISPDFESGHYDKLFYNGSTAPAPFPGSLLPGLVPEDNWYNYNSQDPDIFANATAEWEKLYTYASSLGYQSYLVFQGNSYRDTIDGDIDISRLPTFPISKNPDVRYGIMSYMDAQDDIEGGRYHQYKDCHDQIAIYGDQGRSILTGWIALDTSWYTDDVLGLGRYIEDILICQAAGMNEIFHAPIYRMQSKWGDESVLILHQALNEWEKQEHKLYVPHWEYRDNYMDAVKNFNKWWLFVPMSLFIGLKLSIGGFLKLVFFKKS
ncbi:MAG: hypothetical protein ACTSUE_23545 [Promethearchaeota archaeon]